MAEQATATAQQAVPGWREQNAYTLGVQAYIYCFPWVYMPEARWLRTEDMNHEADVFTHIRKLEDAKHLSGGAPNNDTLYSRAWIYLKDEPVILTVPGDKRPLLHRWKSWILWETTSPMWECVRRAPKQATTPSLDPDGKENFHRE